MTDIPLPCERCNWLPWDCTCQAALRAARTKAAPKDQTVRAELIEIARSRR